MIKIISLLYLDRKQNSERINKSLYLDFIFFKNMSKIVNIL